MDDGIFLHFGRAVANAVQSLCSAVAEQWCGNKTDQKADFEPGPEGYTAALEENANAHLIS